MSTPLAFIGFMGSGKTTAARAIAAARDERVVDADDEIEARAGKQIATIFAEDGEALFRELEEEVSLELLARDDVVSLGGGATGSQRVREALRGRTVVWMDIDSDTAWERARDTGRPLAADREAFERLYAEREPVYASLADLTVPTGGSAAITDAIAALEDVPSGARVLWATSESGQYPAYVGPGLLGWWPDRLAGRRFIVTDGKVASLYGGAIASAGSVRVMPGEQSKTIAHAEIVWTELVRAGMTRADVIVALGGGVVGDLAGFCAATYQRGVRYVQVPTTLVSQVDSAYGGKTGVDLPEAKNYVGAYHQPCAVIADTEALNTLPADELAAGYAEVLKTALLAGGWLWERIRAGAEPSEPELIAACVRTKLRIVACDERDSGPRQALNLGHTVAHALEAATGYARYRHGEAVGLGLLAALRLSGQSELREEIGALLAAKGLPTTLDGADPRAIVRATRTDKKRVGEGPVPFVLLEGPGDPRPGCPVSESELLSAVKELVAQ
jgi:shikimate kinase/3-dehydroquinate synthase